MQIKVLKNFGLNGENLRAGQEVEIDPNHFGDNIGTFRDEGYFEEVSAEAVAPEAAPVAKPEAPTAVAPKEATKIDLSGFQGLNKPPLEG